MEQSKRDKLILDNQRLAYYLYEQLSKTDIVKSNKDDIVSEGMLGLIKAADTFDESKGNRFSTFAGLCIRNQMLMYIRKLNKNWHKEVSLYTPIGEDNEGNQLCYADVIQGDVKEFGEGNNRILLKESIDKLPEKDKEIMLAVITGYKQREIAAMMGGAAILHITANKANKKKTEIRSLEFRSSNDKIYCAAETVCKHNDTIKCGYALTVLPFIES